MEKRKDLINARKLTAYSILKARELKAHPKLKNDLEELSDAVLAKVIVLVSDNLLNQNALGLFIAERKIKINGKRK